MEINKLIQKHPPTANQCVGNQTILTIKYSAKKINQLKYCLILCNIIIPL